MLSRTPTRESTATETPYLQVKNGLMGTARDEGWVDGAPLPSVREIARAYDVSKATVERAVRELKEEGLCYSIRGKGVFLKEKPPESERAATTLGVVFGYESNRDEYHHFYISVYQGLERQVLRDQFNLLSLFHWNKKSAVLKNRELTRFRDAVDGFLLLGVYNDEDCLRVRDSGLPVVALDYDTLALGIDSVVIDSGEIMTSLCQRVLEFDPGKVFYIDFFRATNYDPDVSVRRETFQKAMRKAGRLDDAKRLIWLHAPEGFAKDLAPVKEAIEKGGVRPWLICPDDYAAGFMLKVLRDWNLEPGRDFELACQGTRPLQTDLARYPVLLAAVDYEAVGRVGVELLEERLEKGTGRAECRRIPGTVERYDPQARP